MNPIPYKQDFELAVDFLALADGGPTSVPDCDFRITLKSGISEFSAGRRDGELYNCRVSETRPDTLIVVADNHGLLPCASLKAILTIDLPNPDFADGIQTLRRDIPTDIALVMTADQVPDMAEIKALLPYVKGADGEITREQFDADMANFSENIQMSFATKEELTDTISTTKEELGETISDINSDIENIYGTTERHDRLISNLQSKTEEIKEEFETELEDLRGVDFRLQRDLNTTIGKVGELIDKCVSREQFDADMANFSENIQMTFATKEEAALKSDFTNVVENLNMLSPQLEDILGRLTALEAKFQ